jgi:hypothetical protein
MNKKIQKIDDTIEQHRQQASEMLSGKIEKKRLIIQDTLDNDRRMKLMRQNFNTQMMLRHQEKEKKIGEMKRVWINHKGDPVETLYDSIKV